MCLQAKLHGYLFLDQRPTDSTLGPSSTPLYKISAVSAVVHSMAWGVCQGVKAAGNS